MLCDVGANVHGQEHGDPDHPQHSREGEHVPDPAPIPHPVAHQPAFRYMKVYFVETHVDCSPPVAGVNDEATGPAVDHSVVGARMWPPRLETGPDTLAKRSK